MLEHGGRLREAARRYGRAPEDWLDLSTGLNPRGWPLCALPATAWTRLPEEDDGLREAAQAYYGAAHCLPVAGSQAAIQSLPRLFAAAGQDRIGILSPAYAEHARAWRQAGFAVVPLAAGEIGAAVDDLPLLLVVNPNNPTGHRFETAQLLDWQRRLAARGGALIVDEAFMDATPEHSLAAHTDRVGLIVLRSLGKFFGLAGARVGFVLAVPDLLARLADMLGPWPISGPARAVARAALADRDWQAGTRVWLPRQSRRLRELLQEHGLAPHGGTVLFQWTPTGRAAALYEGLARRGILVRRFREPSSLRFGLPADEPQWRRLAAALEELVSACREAAGQ